MPSTFDPQFWDDEEADLWDTLAPAVIASLLLGVDGGISTLPDNTQALVNYDHVNQAALDYAKNYRYSWIKDITETTRKQTQKAMADWIQSGASLDVLESQLSNIYGETRADSIATTEVTRIFAEGNAQAWQSTGLVSGVRFNTAEDDHVCPYCSPLDGQIFDVDDYGHKPPIHVNCRCYNTPVVDEEAISAALDEALK